MNNSKIDYTYNINNKYFIDKVVYIFTHASNNQQTFKIKTYIQFL